MDCLKLVLILVMIQIAYESSSGFSSPARKDEQTLTASHPYILRRIIYTFILVAVLLAACFYFDFLSDYDLVTMVLGFVVCIILQFIFLSSYFNEEMKELQTDEIGVLKEKIKMTFGELNPTRVQLKARTKYYHREPNEEDKLFQEENDAIFQNVMAHLRVKGEPNFNQLIAKVKGKWLQLESKVKMVEEFLLSMLKLYESRKLVYFRQKNRIKRLHQSEEHLAWTHFLTANIDNPSKSQSLNNTSYYSQDELAFASPKGKELAVQEGSRKNNNEELKQIEINWGIFNIYLIQKIKLAQKEVSDLKDRVCKQFQCFAATVRASNLQFSKNRQKLYQDFKASDLQRNNILRQLEKTASKIVQVSQGLSDRVGGGGEIELTMKREFELRLLKIQSENLLIRLSRAQSCSFSYTDQLYRTLQAEGRQLQYLLQTINNKIHQYNHQMAGFGENRAPPIKRIISESLNKKDSFSPKPLSEQLTADECYTKALNRRNNQGSFRGHLQQLLKFFEEIREENSKASRELKLWKDNLQRKYSGDLRESKVMGQSSEARLFYFTSGINDQKLLRMFEEVNELEDHTSKKIYQMLERQLGSLKQFEQKQGSLFAQEARRFAEDFKKKESDYIKAAKRANKQEQQLVEKYYVDYELAKNKMIEYTNEYLHKKITSFLPEIIKVAIQNEEAYEHIANQIDTDRANDERNQFSSSEDTKSQKYSAFANCIFKTQGEHTIDELLKNQRYSYEESNLDSEVNLKYLIDLSRQSQENDDRNVRLRKPQKISDFFKYESSVPKTLSMANNILGILLHQWSNSELFHEFVKEQLLVSLNRKKPDIVQHLRIDYFRIVERDKDTPIIKNLRPHNSQIYRCLFDLHVNFKGKIAVKIASKFKIGKRPNLEVKLLIKEFQCPIRVCFTPFTIGKSYASLLARPKISIDYSVGVGNFFLTKIPFFTQFIKTYAVLKLRKKFLWPKRMTLAVPLAFKSTLDLAIQQRINYQKQKERIGKKAK